MNYTDDVPELDTKRLVKLLSLTKSSEDNEALSAIRKANDVLYKSDVCWEEVINGLPTKTKKPTYNRELDIIFQYLWDHDELLNDWGLDFLESVFDQFERKHFVTDKQRETLDSLCRQANSKLERMKDE